MGQRNQIRSAFEMRIWETSADNAAEHSARMYKVQSKIVAVMMLEKVWRIVLLLYDQSTEPADEIKAHYADDDPKYNKEVLLSCIQQVLGISLLALMFIQNSTFRSHAGKFQVWKEVIVTLACLIDVPLWRTFTTEHMVLSICFDFILTFIVPFVVCKHVLDATIVTTILFGNATIRGLLMLGLKGGMIDLTSLVIVPYMLIVFIIYQEIHHYLRTSQLFNTEMTVKNQELQTILNTFPEGVFLANYKEVVQEQQAFPQGVQGGQGRMTRGRREPHVQEENFDIQFINEEMKDVLSAVNDETNQSYDGDLNYKATEQAAFRRQMQSKVLAPYKPGETPIKTDGLSQMNDSELFSFKDLI